MQLIHQLAVLDDIRPFNGPLHSGPAMPGIFVVLCNTWTVPVVLAFLGSVVNPAQVGALAHTPDPP